jgi:hypothetical protein
MKTSAKGVTLIEATITVAILGGTIMLTRLGIGFLNTIAQQKATMEVQQQSQSIVFNIAREVRNSKDILEVEKDKLVLSAFDRRHYTYDSPDLYNPVNVGTITYQYRESNDRSYLERTTEFPSDGGTVLTQKLMERMVVAPTDDDYMFKGGPGVAPPYDSVDIVMRLKPIYGESTMLTYNELAVKRAARH